MESKIQFESDISRKTIYDDRFPLLDDEKSISFKGLLRRTNTGQYENLGISIPTSDVLDYALQNREVVIVTIKRLGLVRKDREEIRNLKKQLIKRPYTPQKEMVKEIEKEQEKAYQEENYHVTGDGRILNGNGETVGEPPESSEDGN